jgi:uncharacterized protein (TIGR00369 family)
MIIYIVPYFSGRLFMEILTDPEQIRQHIRDIYKPNHFMMDYFHINIEEIHCGSATVSLKTDPEKHNNQRGVIHGGVFAALADSVTGVTSATVGAVVATVTLTMNFIRTVTPGETIRVTSKVTHRGRSTIAITAEMRDEEGRLMSNILANMMVIREFPEIPHHWNG